MLLYRFAEWFVIGVAVLDLCCMAYFWVGAEKRGG